MRKTIGTWVGVGAALILITGYMLATAGWDLPPVNTTQTGFRGTGMVQIGDRETQATLARLNVPPAPPYEASAEGPRARELYPTLQVLGELSEDQFNRLMAAFAEWVAPKDGENAGCAYCHNPENMADRSKYTHTVSTRMIQMTRTINTTWRPHVADTGVTCYTCHRGQPVPANIWFQDPGRPAPLTAQSGWLGWRNGQNLVAQNAAQTSLPYDHLSAFLQGDRAIRMTPTTALPANVRVGTPTRATTMDTEWTYALMMHMSTSLGVNCTFCHNSRAFNVWEESPRQRVTAWHGIRMARELNLTYLEPLRGTYPAHRLGPLGDAPKLNCGTCHQGVNRPLNGAPMLADYRRELGTAPGVPATGAMPAGAAPPASAPAPAPGVAPAPAAPRG